MIDQKKDFVEKVRILFFIFEVPLLLIVRPYYFTDATINMILITKYVPCNVMPCKNSLRREDKICH